MLIRLDIAIAELEDMPADVKVDFFSELLRSSRLGYHRVIIPRSIADWVEENIGLSTIDKAHLKRVRSEYTQLAGQFEQSSMAVRIVFGEAVERSEDRRVISIGHSRMIDGGYLLKSILLLENAINDGGLIALVLRHEAKRVSFGELSYEVANGGGATTAGELERLASAGRIIACVCDTDIKVPGGARSPTFNATMTKSAALDLVGIAVGTPGAEAENFIPLSIIDQMFRAAHPASCQLLSQVMQAQGDCASEDCFWLYFDIKRGISSMLPCLNTQGKSDWACRKLGVNVGALGGLELAGFGDGVIAEFLHNEPAQADFFRFSRTPYWAIHFSDWIRRVLWIVCGRVALRTG
jgi:hypothetical protein